MPCTLFVNLSLFAEGILYRRLRRFPNKEVKYFEMAIKIRLRRFVALLLCCVLVGSSFPVQAYATDPVTAASLAITGGQLAGAGLSGEAALSLAGPVGAVVGITLGALGVNAYVSKAAQQAGKTRTRFVADKLVLWGAQAGYSIDQLYSKIAEGISVAADGTIQLTDDVSKMIQQFGNWAFEQDGLVVQNPSVSNPNASAIGDYQGIKYNIGSDSDRNYFNVTDSIATYIATYTTKSAMVGSQVYLINLVDTVAVLSLSNLRANFWVTGYDGNDEMNMTFSVNLVRSGSGSSYYIGETPAEYPMHIAGAPTYDITFSQFVSAIRGLTFEDVTITSDEVFTGTPDSWAENKDVLNPSADDTPITLNPDLLNPIIDSLADGQQATMSIIDYLQALQDAWDHALDDVQTAIGTITDSLTGIQQQIAVPQEAVANPTVTNPSVTPDTTPILDPSGVDPGTAVTGLSFDLTQIFPFCIPFDIYDMLATLSATPEAPVYHVHYEGPYNILIDFTVDLSPWDSVASVLRTVELLAFCIGLAYVTRSMFIRS